MNFDFRSGTITIVIAPVDLRSGYAGLSSLALTQLNIQVGHGKDFVVFVSRNSGLCKMIWTDEKGTNLLTRRLHFGRFERFLARIDEAAVKILTYEDLCQFLDGRHLMVKRNRIHESDSAPF